ncbi:hypothetical protein [Methylobacterium sp. J-090]|uniref:hypothetical protein n=1 Tax=Methylobacterium sp. J-090 TaxID=2836666 RepID=UPI001FBBE620|nr:hypothetical protein [Methylobacterium sp. J-090]MCJ2083753.1 hypothetical protein [Methylobacterium sp. J-090]
MSAQTRFVALMALCWAGAATAQTAPADRAWTDPPARGAVAPPAARPAPEAPKVAETPKPHAKSSAARSSAVKSSTKPHRESRAAARVPKTRVTAAHRRSVVTVRTLTPTDPGVRSAPVRIVHAQASPAHAAARARPVAYGFIAPPPPPDAFREDPRARRIRQAEAAGYLVVRRSTVAAPDGRLLYGYRPYESDDFDD